MQIGSATGSNFRQRRSQSIMGTKQLKVDGTASGSYSSSRHEIALGVRLHWCRNLVCAFVRSIGCGRLISLPALPWSVSAPSPVTRGGCGAWPWDDRRNWDSKSVAKIALHLANSISAGELFSFPTCAMLCTLAPDLPLGSATGWEYGWKRLPEQWCRRTTVST
jgi:hypothetical protein